MFLKVLVMEHNMPRQLVTHIEFFFSKIESKISMSQEYEVHSLLNDLPANLRSRLAMFLYNDAIQAIPFLQNRDELFYNKYLELLTPQKFLHGAKLIKAKTHSEELFMILNGEVRN